jgi:hypothetical protein
LREPEKKKETPPPKDPVAEGEKRGLQEVESYFAERERQRQKDEAKNNKKK